MQDETFLKCGSYVEERNKTEQDYVGEPTHTQKMLSGEFVKRDKEQLNNAKPQMWIQWWTRNLLNG